MSDPIEETAYLAYPQPSGADGGEQDMNDAMAKGGEEVAAKGSVVSEEEMDVAPSKSEYVPYVSHNDYREFTIRGTILASSLAIILGAANVYLGLLVGLTVSASIPASVISMACLKLFKDSNILENNIVQTAASAGEALAAGVIFTLPGLVIITNYNTGKIVTAENPFEGAYGWDTFLGVNYAYVFFLSLLGGLCGIMMSIPIRAALIIDIQPPLCFPEGVATAGVLKAGEASGWSALAVVTGSCIGSVTKLMESMGLWDPAMVFGWLYQNMHPSYIGWNVTSSLFGVGYIVGWKTTLVLALGSLIHNLIILPVFSVYQGGFDAATWDPRAGEFNGKNVASYLFGTTKYVGVGMMMIGAVWALITIRKPLYQSVKLGSKEIAYQLRRTGEVVELKRYEKDIPATYSMSIVVICFFALYVVYGVFNRQWGWDFLLAIFGIIVGFLFSAVAAFMAGLVGSSNNPISGVTICSTIVVSGLVLAMFGASDPYGPPTVIFLACAIACTCAISGDNMQDLKAGHILGATPWKQEVIMCLGVVSCAVVIAPIMELLDQAYVMGSPELPAPQAFIIATIPTGIINGTLPWGLMGFGVGYGAVVIVMDLILYYTKVPFRLPVLAFAVANYLPINYILPMFFGGMISLVFSPGGSTEDLASEGTLFAAGLIAGDALTGIVIAVPIVISGDADVLQVVNDPKIWAAIFPLIWLSVGLACFAKFQPFVTMGKKRANAQLPIAGDSLESPQQLETVEDDGGAAYGEVELGTYDGKPGEVQVV